MAQRTTEQKVSERKAMLEAEVGDRQYQDLLSAQAVQARTRALQARAATAGLDADLRWSSKVETARRMLSAPQQERDILLQAAALEAGDAAAVKAAVKAAADETTADETPKNGKGRKHASQSSETGAAS